MKSRDLVQRACVKNRESIADIGQSHKGTNERERGNSCVDHTRVTVLNLFRGFIPSPLFPAIFNLRYLSVRLASHSDFTKSAIDSLSLSRSTCLALFALCFYYSPFASPLLFFLLQVPVLLQVSLYSPSLSFDPSFFSLLLFYRPI